MECERRNRDLIKRKRGIIHGVTTGFLKNSVAWKTNMIYDCGIEYWYCGTMVCRCDLIIQGLYRL